MLLGAGSGGGGGSSSSSFWNLPELRAGRGGEWHLCQSFSFAAAAAARAPCPQLKGKEEGERGRKFDGSLTWADALKLCVYAALENSRIKKEDFAYVFYRAGSSLFFSSLEPFEP